ncbi:unnamed protein product [Amoebophrya sp. A120]|nr:unnamed protein product [Amoebophrya sp. A120]|eukprot:GSA120T00020031001.1
MGGMLSSPIEVVRLQRQRGHLGSCAVAEMQGWRENHEDAHFFSQPDANGWATFGVLDGHGGYRAARLAAEKLPAALKKATTKRKAKDGPCAKKLDEAFEEVDRELREELVGRHGDPADSSGTTCVVGLVKCTKETGKYSCFIANAGDSRGIIVRLGTETHLTTSANSLARSRAVSTEVEPPGSPKKQVVDDDGIATPDEVKGLSEQTVSAVVENKNKNTEVEYKSPDLELDRVPENPNSGDEDGTKTTKSNAANNDSSSPAASDGGAKTKNNDESHVEVRLPLKTKPAGDDPDEDISTMFYAEGTASIDHKPSRKCEFDRIIKAGGSVSGMDGQQGFLSDCPRLDGNLAVSRGFGDFQYKMDFKLPASEQKVSCHPELFSMHDLDAGDLVILACDGIFDVMSNEDLISFVVERYHMLQPKYTRREDLLAEICGRCVQHCLGRDSKDNMTMMIIQLGPPLDETNSPAAMFSFTSEQRKANKGKVITPGTPSAAASPASAVKLPTFEQEVKFFSASEQVVRQGIVGEKRTQETYATFLEYCETGPEPCPINARVAAICQYKPKHPEITSDGEPGTNAGSSSASPHGGAAGASTANDSAHHAKHHTPVADHSAGAQTMREKLQQKIQARKAAGGGVTLNGNSILNKKAAAESAAAKNTSGTTTFSEKEKEKADNIAKLLNAAATSPNGTGPASGFTSGSTKAKNGTASSESGNKETTENKEDPGAPARKTPIVLPDKEASSGSGDENESPESTPTAAAKRAENGGKANANKRKKKKK